MVLRRRARGLLRLGFLALAAIILLGQISTAAESTREITEPSSKGTNHWAYQPLSSTPAPAVRDKSWARSWVDSFILARIEANGLRPGVDADPSVLCRRIHFDLIGLPPAPQELDGFIRAASKDQMAAVSELVDRLLASPRFGEHWARH